MAIILRVQLCGFAPFPNEADALKVALRNLLLNKPIGFRPDQFTIENVYSSVEDGLGAAVTFLRLSRMIPHHKGSKDFEAALQDLQISVEVTGVCFAGSASPHLLADMLCAALSPRTTSPA